MSVHTRQIATAGGPVGLAWVGGGLLAAWQSSAGVGVSLIVADVNATTLEVSRVQGLSLGDDVGAWPVVYASGDRAWIGYREGKSLGGRAVVINRDRGEVWRSSGEAGGNHPIALGRIGGADCLAWQRFGDNAITIHRLDNPAWAIAGGYGAPDGLAALDGGPVLWKDNYGSAWPAMTAPSRAGVLVAGEHPDSGVIVRAPDGRVLRLFEGMAGATPVLAFDAPTGRYAVATWGRLADGVEHGVRVATFLEADLVAATPAVDPWPRYVATGTGADRVVEWLSGGGWTVREDVGLVDVDALWCGRGAWARSGMPAGTTPVDYTHPMQGRVLESGAVQITKALGEGPRAAVFTRAGGYLGLAFDGTNELSKGYRLVWPGTDQTARLYPSLMGVTPNRATRRERERCRRDVPVERLDLATGARLPVVWRGWVEAVFDGPALGDVPAGLYALVGWTFDIVGDGVDGDPNGVVELSLCHEQLGPVAWRETHRRTGAVRTWYGVRNVARIPDPEPQFADALPKAPSATPPKPEPEPEPPVKIWAYNDVDAVRVIEFLELKYLTPVEQNGLGRTEVDKLGIARWNHDAIRLLDGGRSVDATLKEINRRINQIVGLPLDGWPGAATEPVPDQPVPGVSRLVGPLRIAADRSAFIDDTGPVLPVLCHLGDGLSRWTRDPEGVSALLDDIAGAGYDGVRTWTVLGGSSYWNGREVGPMYQSNYFAHVTAFTAALRARGLRWLVSQGDAMRMLPTTPERQGFMRALAERLDLEIVAGVDAGNELLWNGETDPAKMRAAVDAFRAVLPCAVWSLTSPGSEEKADLDKFSGSVFDVHGYRDNRAWDKVRHIFSIGYEGKPSARLGVQSEPFGYGDLVSASANKDELTSGVLALACAVSLLSRQAWVYFSGPGVKSDAGQRLQDMPGFRETCAMRDALPRDLMTFQTLVHGGESQKGRRVFEVPGTDSTRCDHALHADGRFVCAVYGESWRLAYQEKTCQIEKRIDCGEAGYVIVGRV